MAKRTKVFRVRVDHETIQHKLIVHARSHREAYFEALRILKLTTHPPGTIEEVERCCGTAAKILQDERKLVM